MSAAGHLAAAPSIAGSSRPRPAGRRSRTYEHLILGAGCSGLSLAWHLLEAGAPGPIALVDRRTDFRNDRTWCFWDVESSPFDDLATHAWDRWAIIDSGGRALESGPGRYRYLRVRAADFYGRVLGRLAAEPGVDLYLGEPIRARVEGPDVVVAEALGGPIRGRRAFDGARRPDDLVRRAPAGRVALLQHFFGQLVRASRPTFDAGRALLMDFRADQGDGPHFFYVLPLSSTEALVENTYLTPAHVPAARHRSEIAAYLGRSHGLGRFEVIEEEAGRIPMTAGRPRRRRGGRLIEIGLAGGAARPSSGYAFRRIQRQSRAIAAAIAAGREPAAAPFAGRKYDVLDAIFLRVLADRPADAPRIFARMFGGPGPDPLARFMSDRSGPLDDARLIASLPKWPFVAGAIRSVATWMPALLGRG